MKESDLYKPMCDWLEKYLKSKYKRGRIITIDSHAERLDRVLAKYNIVNHLATGVDIQIDVLGIVIISEDNYKLFFIEAKKTNLTLRDLGQLWAYCKLINPEEAFLLTSGSLGSLDKILRNYSREDLLDFGNRKKIKKMKVGLWDIKRNCPDTLTIIPKI